MTFYGYIAPVARLAGFSAADLTWVLVIVGVGLVIGNTLGGRTADANLRLSLILWPAAMIVSLIVAGFAASFKFPFLAAAFVFGIASFANVPPMQMRVMKYGKAAPELAATANISAFNIANALGGLIGGAIVDSSFGASAIPFAAAVIPAIALLFILSQERGGSIGRALFRPASIAAQTAQRSRCTHSGGASSITRRYARTLAHFRFFKKRSRSPSLNLASTKSYEPSHPPASRIETRRLRPLCAVGSTDRCNTFCELLSWGLIEQGLSRPFV